MREEQTAEAMAVLFQFRDVTEKIIGCAFRVYNRLGYGFLESVYEKALLIELRRLGLKAESQVPITVYYDGEVVGEFVADILVEDTIVVELKSIRTLATTHEIQLVNYLTATEKPVGLLLNFGERGVEIKRKIRTLPRPTPQSAQSC
jgi:GxxExxY protein